MKKKKSKLRLTYESKFPYPPFRCIYFLFFFFVFAFARSVTCCLWKVSKIESWVQKLAIRNGRMWVREGGREPWLREKTTLSWIIEKGRETKKYMINFASCSKVNRKKIERKGEREREKKRNKRGGVGGRKSGRGKGRVKVKKIILICLYSRYLWNGHLLSKPCSNHYLKSISASITKNSLFFLLLLLLPCVLFQVTIYEIPP